MTDAASGPDPEVKFISVGYLIEDENIRFAEIASAIERYGVIAMDRFGRRVAAKKGPSSEPATIAYVLQKLAENRDRWWDDLRFLDDSFDSRFIYTVGWFSNQLPDFETLKKQNNAEISVGYGTKGSEEADPAKQSAIWKLLKGLVVLCYGETIAEDLRNDRSSELSKIQKDLETKGFRFDTNTLRKYLKNLPD